MGVGDSCKLSVKKDHNCKKTNNVISCEDHQSSERKINTTKVSNLKMKAECLEAAARCDSSAHDKTENKGKKDHKVLSLSFKFLFRVKGCK